MVKRLSKTNRELELDQKLLELGNKARRSHVKALEQLPTDCSIPEFNEKLEYDDKILKKIYKEMFGEELQSKVEVNHVSD